MTARISKVIAGIAAVIIIISGCCLDSVSSLPIAIWFGGIALLGAAIWLSPEVFE